MQRRSVPVPPRRWSGRAHADRHGVQLPGQGANVMVGGGRTAGPGVAVVSSPEVRGRSVRRKGNADERRCSADEHGCCGVESGGGAFLAGPRRRGRISGPFQRRVRFGSGWRGQAGGTRATGHCARCALSTVRTALSALTMALPTGRSARHAPTASLSQPMVIPAAAQQAGPAAAASAPAHVPEPARARYGRAPVKHRADRHYSPAAATTGVAPPATSSPGLPSSRRSISRSS